MSRARHLKPFPKGRRLEMTEKWKDDVRAALGARGVGQDWLAQQVGAAGRGTISKLLKRNLDGQPVQSVSALVPRICEVLGLDLPLVPALNPRDARVLELLKLVPDDTKDAIIALLETSAKRGV